MFVSVLNTQRQCLTVSVDSVSPEVIQPLLQIGVCISQGGLGLRLLPSSHRQASSGAREIWADERTSNDKTNVKKKRQAKDGEHAGSFAHLLDSSSDRLRPSSSSTWDTMASLCTRHNHKCIKVDTKHMLGLGASDCGGYKL